MERRRKQEELVQALQARRASYEVLHMLELLKVMLEGAKNNLLTCGKEEFAKLQGEAQTYDKLIRMLTRASVNSSAAKE